jgi:hypothetical protein
MGSLGLINEHVLNLFRSSEIRSLDLTASLADEGGLNMSGGDTLRGNWLYSAQSAPAAMPVFLVFSAPNSFLFLTNLSFAGTPLCDSDLAYIHHLPKLAYLNLDRTDIGNEASVVDWSRPHRLADPSINTAYSSFSPSSAPFSTSPSPVTHASMTSPCPLSLCFPICRSSPPSILVLL